MGTRIKAALFDKDGTLIDFTASWRGLVDDMIADYAGGDEALANALGAAIGYDRGTGVFLPGSPIVSDTSDVIADLMAELLPGRTPEEIEDDANRRAASSGVTAVAGLRETLETLRGMGLVLGIGTHDSETAARVQAKDLGIADLIDFYAGYDSGHILKPGPGMPNGFSAATGVATADMVMVGDSIHDLGAGRSAGCAASIGVLTGPATEAELEQEADIILPSIADLPDFLRRAFPA